MARKLRTKQGGAVNSRRKTIVEPVFGQIDTLQNWRRLLLRGKAAARNQWRFHCAVHNLLKLHRAGGLDAIKAQNGAPASPSARKRRALATLAARIHRLAARLPRPHAITDAQHLSHLAAVSVTDPGS